MTSRIVTRAGREGPKYVKAFLRQSPAAPTALSRTATMLMSHARSSQQAGGIQSMVNHLGSSYMQKNTRFFSDKAAPLPPSAEEEEDPTTEEDATKSAEGDEATAVTDAEEPAEPEVNREEQLEEELKAAKDQLLRSLAEQENTRRIAKRDVSDARNFAVKSFAKSVLEVSDNLTRALDVVPEELRNDKENHATLATLYEGIEMTEAGLVKAFESNGLKKFGEPGEVFDPNQHNALYEYPDPEKEAGTVGQVIKVGFMLNNRVLRPAEVGIVKKE